MPIRVAPDSQSVRVAEKGMLLTLNAGMTIPGRKRHHRTDSLG